MTKLSFDDSYNRKVLEQPSQRPSTSSLGKQSVVLLLIIYFPSTL